MMAAASLSPLASMFHKRTMAMQRARPIMMSPVRYSGRSGSITQASVNISTGPKTQLKKSEAPKSLPLALKVPRVS
ncbi:hypothetical protein D3C72_2415350 [compost metagenome]